jgi:hypothetical protein
MLRTGAVFAQCRPGEKWEIPPRGGGAMRGGGRVHEETPTWSVGASEYSGTRGQRGLAVSTIARAAALSVYQSALICV